MDTMQFWPLNAELCFKSYKFRLSCNTMEEKERNYQKYKNMQKAALFKTAGQ